MNHKMLLLTGILVVSICIAASGQNDATTSATAASKNIKASTGHPDADSVLNEARMNLVDGASASKRIAAIEHIMNKYPDLRTRAELKYYIGLNAQTLGQYEKAGRVYAEALKAEPQIAQVTSIMSYIKKAKVHTFTKRANIILISLLVLILLPAIWRLTKADALTIRWGGIFFVYTLMVILWIAAIYFLPKIIGAPHTGLETFPKPTLSNFQLGQIGDIPLRALLFFGLAAILATLPVVTAVSRIKSSVARIALTFSGVILTIGAVMALYGVRYLYVDSKYNVEGKRYIFVVRSIDSMREVPDAMLPLYEEAYRKRVIEARGKKEE